MNTVSPDRASNVAQAELPVDPILPDDVRGFVLNQQLDSYLDLSRVLALRHFDVDRPLTFSRESDTETGQEWVEVSVAARGSVEEVLDANDRYTDAWVAAVPPDRRALIRLVYEPI